VGPCSSRSLLPYPSTPTPTSPPRTVCGQLPPTMPNHPFLLHIPPYTLFYRGLCCKPSTSHRWAGRHFPPSHLQANRRAGRRRAHAPATLLCPHLPAFSTLPGHPHYPHCPPPPALFVERAVAGRPATNTHAAGQGRDWTAGAGGTRHALACAHGAGRKRQPGVHCSHTHTMGGH